MEIIRKVKVPVFPTCPLPPLLHNEMPAMVTLMRCVRDTDYSRLPAQLPRNRAGLPDLQTQGTGFCLHFPILYHFLLTLLPPTRSPARRSPAGAERRRAEQSRAEPLLTFSSAFCTRGGCDVSCHRAGAAFIALPVANPGLEEQDSPSQPSGEPIKKLQG